MRKLLLAISLFVIPFGTTLHANVPTVKVRSERLVLYYMPTCRYCKPVLAKIEQKNIPVTLKNVSADPAAREELIEKGGKGQVPCLMINGKVMYESGAILKYLDDNY